MADAKPLPFEYPPLMPDETLQGFVARIAGYYETGFNDYCALVGIPSRELLAGRHRAILRVAAMTGITPSKLSHQAFTYLGRGAVTYRGQVLDRCALRRMNFHGCPACLQDDIAASPFAPEIAAWVRGTWFVRAVWTCPVHCLGLVPLHSEQNCQTGGSLLDSVRRLWPSLDELERIREAAPVRRVSGLEAYVIGRLHGNTLGVELLNTVPLHAAIRTCEAIGAVALFGPKTKFGSFNDDDWRAAGGAGFDVIAAGPKGLPSLLTALQRQYRHGRSRNGGARDVLGALYNWICTCATGPDYGPVRQIVREHILETMPVAAGTHLFGVPVDRRRFHSVFTACWDGRKVSKRLARELRTAGLLPNGLDGDRQAWVNLSAQELDSMRSRLAAGLSKAQATARLCITGPQFQRLLDTGLVRPIVPKDPSERVHLRFAVDDLDDFVREVDRVAPILPHAPAGMIALSKVALNATVQMTTILEHLFAGRLPGASRLPGATGYASILIDPEALRCVFRLTQVNPNFNEAARRMHVHVLVPSMLVKAGHLRICDVKGTKTCKRVRSVTVESFHAFTSEMASLVELSMTHGIHRTTMLSLLGHEGVRPALLKREVGATFYRRSDVDAAARVRGRPWSG